MQTHTETNSPKNSLLRTKHNIQNVGVYPEQIGENIFLKIIIAMEGGFEIINNYV